jgi:hypothetical protein
MQVERVQKWVMSALLMVTGFIFAGGLCFLAAVAEGPGAQPGLLIIAGFVGVITMLGVRVINEARFVSPWLLLGVVPPLVGWYLLYVA